MHHPNTLLLDRLNMQLLPEDSWLGKIVNTRISSTDRSFFFLCNNTIQFFFI